MSFPPRPPGASGGARRSRRCSGLGGKAAGRSAGARDHTTWPLRRTPGRGLHQGGQRSAAGGGTTIVFRSQQERNIPARDTRHKRAPAPRCCRSGASAIVPSRPGVVTESGRRCFPAKEVRASPSSVGSNPTHSAPLDRPAARCRALVRLGRGARADEWNGLENRRAPGSRGFESRPLRPERALEPYRAGPRREPDRDHELQRTRPVARRPPARTRSSWADRVLTRRFPMPVARHGALTWRNASCAIPGRTWGTTTPSRPPSSDQGRHSTLHPRGSRIAGPACSGVFAGTRTGADRMRCDGRPRRDR